MERKPGYYWVKIKHWSFVDRWVIGKYKQSEKRPDWYVEGGWSDDSDLMEINETRIPTPDEKSVNIKKCDCEIPKPTDPYDSVDRQICRDCSGVISTTLNNESHE